MLTTVFTRRLAGLAGTFALVLLGGCASQEHDAIVARVGTDPITVSEFSRLYNKSNGDSTVQKASQADREKFLDLVVKYRLKLADAYAERLDRSPEVVNEIAQYRGSLASSYLLEREVVRPGIRSLYNRRNEEIRLSYILLPLSPNPTPADSIAAYKKAADAIAQLNAGRDFGDVAVAMSGDPSVRTNRGDIYYFTAGQLDPAMEDTVFALKVGEFTRVPLRNRYGLNIMKVTDRHPAPGDRLCSHIMVRFLTPNPSPADTLKAYQKIKALQDSLAKGTDFAELAKRHSEDPGSAPRGGDLGWFTRRRWPQPFDEVAMSLKPGQVSGIVRTIYGYHIIKCYDARPPKSFEESKDELQSLYQRTRYQSDYSTYMARLRNELHFTENDTAVSEFLAALDSTKTTKDSAWAGNVPVTLGRLVIYSVDGTAYTVDDVIGMIDARSDLGTTQLKSAPMRTALSKVADQVVFDAEADRLQKQQPEFASIMKEYKEGILLYQIEQQKVWEKISSSDSALRVYFDAHRDKFRFPDRVDITEIRLANESVATAAYTRLQAGETPEDIAREDSIRMARKLSYEMEFPGTSVIVSRTDAKTLASMAGELEADHMLKVRLVSHPDTSVRRERNLALARRRTAALRSYLWKKLGIDTARVFTAEMPVKPDSSSSMKSRLPAQSRIDGELLGRAPMVIGKVTTEILPRDSDERTRMTDSLAEGAYTRPFQFKGLYSIVRLNHRDPAHLKTFEEAGSELSGAFQDSESKRLEDEWIAGLKAKYPVVEYREVLKQAFAAPTQTSSR